MAQKAGNVIHALAGTIWQALLCFYQALTLTALYPFAPEEDWPEYWKKLVELQAKMKIWADNCPENFSYQHLLTSAEMAKISGNFADAVDLYEEAITTVLITGETGTGKELVARAIHNLSNRWGLSVQICFID